MIISSQCFEVYSGFSKDIKSASIQCSLMNCVYWYNVTNQKKGTLNSYLESKALELNAKLQLKKELIRSRYEVSHEAVKKYEKKVCKSLNEDIVNLPLEIRSGFWKKKITGQAIKQKWKFKHIYRVIGSHASLITHPLFRLMNDSNVILQSPSKFINKLPNSIKLKLLKNQQSKNYLFSDIPKIWKQPYRQQQENLVNDIQLDSLLILILMAIYQQSFLLKARPTVPEQLAYILFKKLFCVKYPISSANTIAVKISELLEMFSLSTLTDRSEEDLKTGEQHFDEVLSFYRNSIFKNDKALKLNYEELVTGLSHLETLEYSNDINNGFLWF